MRALKVIALIIILLFSVISGWVFMAGTGVDRTFLNSSYYGDIVSSGGIFPDILYADGGCSCAACMEMQQNIQDYDYLETDKSDELAYDYETIKRDAFFAAFDEDWLQEQFLIVIDDLLAMLKGVQEYPTVVIDLQDAKEGLKNEMINLIKKQSSEEKTDNGEMSSEELILLAEEMVNNMNLPEKIVIADLMEELLTPASEKNIRRIQLFQNYYLIISCIAFILFLVLNYLLAGLSAGMIWFGAAAFLSGSVFTGGLQLFRIRVFDPFLNFFGSGMPVKPDVVSSAASHTFSLLSHIPLIFAALGLVLVVTGIVLKRKQSDPVDGAS